jgi:hypothetical protein
MRHEFFDAVLTKKETVDYVIANLKLLILTPIITSYSQAIQQQFVSQFAIIKSL